METIFNKIISWINSCNELPQIQSCRNLENIFRRKYPDEHIMAQRILKQILKKQRELI